MCPRCSKPEGLVCECGEIFPPRALDKFEALGVPRRFDLDDGELDARYRDLSRKVHPDRFAMAEPKQRVASLQAATTLNDAYRLLSQPMARAAHLLELAGVKVDEHETSDPAFLLEIMELREELAAARHDAPKLRALGENMQKRHDQTLAAIADGFHQYDATHDRAHVAKIQRDLVAARFYRRYLDEVEAGLEAA